MEPGAQHCGQGRQFQSKTNLWSVVSGWEALLKELWQPEIWWSLLSWKKEYIQCLLPKVRILQARGRTKRVVPWGREAASGWKSLRPEPCWPPDFSWRDSHAVMFSLHSIFQIEYIILVGGRLFMRITYIIQYMTKGRIWRDCGQVTHLCASVSLTVNVTVYHLKALLWWMS